MKKILTAMLMACCAIASATPVDIVITGSYILSYEEDDEEETSDWYFSATDDSGLYKVRLDYLTDEAGKYGTYTYADIDHDYSYIKDYTSGEVEYLNYLEGTTFTVSEVNGLLHIEGTLVCDNGVTYNLHVDHVPQAYDIEATELVDIYYFDEDADWYFRVQNGDYRICLDLTTGSSSRFSGTYTEADAVEGYNYVMDLRTGCYDPFTTFSVTLSMPQGVHDPTRAFEVSGTAVSEHGDHYNFHFIKNLPIKPKQSVTLNVDLKAAEWPSMREDCSSYYEVTEQADPQHQWNLGLNALMGTLDESGFIDSLTCRVNTSTGEILKVDNGTVTQSFDSTTLSIRVNAALVMTDSIEYCFSFSPSITTKGKSVYSFDNLTLNDDYYSSESVQWLKAGNDVASFEMTLTGADVPGEYDSSTAFVAMAVRGSDGERSAVTSLAILNASTTLDVHNQPVLNAWFLGSDKRVYAVDAHFDIPTPVDTLDLAITGLKALDYLSTLGVFQVYGYNNDSSVYVALVPEASQFTGHYTTASLSAYRSYSLLALRQPDGSYEECDFYTADFNVTQAGEEINLVGSFQAGKHWVNLNLKAKIRPEGIDYDSEDEDLDVNFTLDDLTSLESGDGYAYVELRNAERGDIFSMLFYLDTFDPDIVIPEGTYDVNETYEAPSVQAGSLGSNTLYPAYYATLDDGYLYLPFWFLVRGTVTVSKTEARKLKFEVNGWNSFDRTIHVTLDGTSAALPAIEENNASRPAKVLEQGRLLIHQGDRTYNLFGQSCPSNSNLRIFKPSK